MSSDSDLASAVAELRFNNYMSLAIVTAVAYDYVVTFSSEINYVWNRSEWTFVTAMFALVRYMGIFVVLTEGLCTVLLLASDCAFVVFLGAADIVMILRIYALYDRSKILLGFLLALCFATIVLYTASAIFYANPNTNMTMTTTQVLDMSFCDPQFNTTVQLGKYKIVPRLTLAGLLFVLVVVRSCIDSFQAYKETKRWETGKYVDLFLREGIIYFAVHVLNNVDFGQSVAGMIVNAIIFTVMFVLSPRFIISVRELHARKILRVSGRCSGIDAGFGSSLGQFSHIVGVQEENVEMQAVGRTDSSSC